MTGFNQPTTNINSLVYVLFFIIGLSTLSACSLANGKARREGGRSGIELQPGSYSSIEVGAAFHHVVFSKPEQKILPGPLRIYIEGDGKPFINRTSIARDPTPVYAPVLKLWNLDPGDAVYIGRPCYLGLAKLPECNAGLWTSGRYGALIVESMQSIAERHSAGRPIVLIGHSGGGALAMLIADRMRKEAGAIAAVVTLSGNLDVAGWTKLHGYTPLHHSESPADKLPLPGGIAQLHVVAGRDSKIPPALTLNLANRLPDGSICEVPSYDHNCCWNHQWVKFLSALDQHLLTGRAGWSTVCAVF